MPEATLEKPETEQTPESDEYQFSSEPTPPPVEPEAKPEVEAPPVVEPIVEKKPDAPPPEKHSVEAIQQAARLGIPPEDVEEMTPKELARTITHMNRFGQLVWDSASKKTETAPEPKKEEPAVPAHYDLEKNDKGYDPEIVETIRMARQVAAENKEFKKQLQAIVDDHQETKREHVHQRINGLLSGMGAEASKAFDRTTAAGAENFRELMFTMKAQQDASIALGKDRSERELLERSIRAMGVSVAKVDPKKAEKEEALKEKEEEFDGGALSKPVSRGGPVEPLEVIRDLLKKKGMPVSKSVNERTVEWPD